MNPSTELARAVVDALIEAGIREIVLAPGSRNAPLAYAVHDAEAAGLLRLHVRIDERSAGFLALGLTRSGRRAAVICTSGTAVANLHPALLEAAHAAVPVVAVTADRPARLRGTDANQTTDQVGVFGPLIATADIAGPADVDVTPAWEAPGPTHWNIQLDEPLLPDDADTAGAGATSGTAGGGWRPTATPRPPRQWPTPRLLEAIDAGPASPRTVVVAGDDAGPAARRLAETAGWPLLAEPSSGSRTGDHAIRTYRLLLGDESLRGRIERVVVYGHPTLSRPITRLLADPAVEVWAEQRRAAWPERSFPTAQTFRTALHVDRTLDSTPGEGQLGSGEGQLGWLGVWQQADRAVARQVDALLAASPVLTGQQVAAAVAASIPAGGQLVVGPSSPIRDLDLMHRPTPVGERRKIIANRGLAGIDGLVSTAIGAALGRPEGPTYALVGDLTFLHDANGLVIGPGEPRPESLTIVVANDDGGSIFATLEQGAPDHARRFERLFGTPHGTSIEQLCAATRTPYARVTTPGELAHTLSSPNGGIEVVEAVISRTGRRELDEQLRGLRR